MSNNTVNKIENKIANGGIIFCFFIFFLILYAIFIKTVDTNKTTKQQIELCKSTYSQNYTEIKDNQCYDPVRIQSKEIPKN